MKCERCAQDEAVIHLSHVRAGAVTLRHLCRACAEARGIPVPPLRAPTDWEVVARIDRDGAS